MYDSWVFSSPLYETVFWYLPPPRKIIDVGCGYGGSTILLACIGYDVTAVDIDEEMLAKATANASLFEKIGNTPVTFELADTFDLSKYYGKFDIAFSDGVIEHFTPEDAVRALREQAKTARYVVVAVPTKCLNESFEVYRYPHTLQSLQALCKRAGLKIVRKLAIGNPPQPSLVALQRITPPAVWNPLLRNYFSTKAACICQAPMPNQ